MLLRRSGLSRTPTHEGYPLQQHSPQTPWPTIPTKQPLEVRAPALHLASQPAASACCLNRSIGSTLHAPYQPFRPTPRRVSCAGSPRFAAATSSLQRVEPIADVAARYHTLLVDGDLLMMKLGGNHQLDPTEVAQRMMVYVQHVWAGFETVEVWVSGWRAAKPGRGEGKVDHRRRLCAIAHCFNELAGTEPLATMLGGRSVSAHVAAYGDADLALTQRAACVSDSIVAGDDSDFRLGNLPVITSMSEEQGSSSWLASVLQPSWVTEAWSLPSDVWDVLRAVEEHDYGRAILGAGSARLARYLVRIKDTLPEGERLTVGKVYDQLACKDNTPFQPRLAESGAAELLVLGAVLRHGLPALSWSHNLGRFTAHLEAREAVLSVLGQGPWSGTDMVNRALERVVYMPDLSGLDEEQQAQRVADMERGTVFYDGTDVVMPPHLQSWAKSCANLLARPGTSESAWTDTSFLLQGPCAHSMCRYHRQPVVQRKACDVESHGGGGRRGGACRGGVQGLLG